MNPAQCQSRKHHALQPHWAPRKGDVQLKPERDVGVRLRGGGKAFQAVRTAQRPRVLSGEGESRRVLREEAVVRNEAGKVGREQIMKDLKSGGLGRAIRF